MDIHNIDLNLLVALHAMDQHRSVTRAAESIGLSQPAMSAAVARLRVLFDDPLFVKTGSAMQPTRRALALAAPVRKIIETLRDEVLLHPSFDPASAERTFTLVMPDIAEANILPRIVKQLAATAPRVRLRTVGMPPQKAAEAMEADMAELAIGYYPDLQTAGFFQQRLFKSSYVCIARKGRKGLAGGLSMEAFLAASHAVVRPGGREHVLEKFLKKKQWRREVALEVSNFMSLLPIVAETELIATVPRDLAELLAAHAPIQLLATPFSAPTVDIHQFWHKRLHDDEAHVWLRQQVQAVFH